MLVALLKEGDIFPRLPLDVRPHTSHVQGQLPRVLKVGLKEIIEHHHMGLLAEQHMIGQILQHLEIY